jgi:5'(3')-deoxyribonucleotidase
MDGVLVDWLEAVREFVGKPESYHQCFHDAPDSLSEDTVNALYGETELRKINLERPAEFWVGLKKFPWADKLITTLKKDYEVAFFSSPGDNPNAAQGKVIWQQKYHPDIPLILGKHKHLAAASNKVLIDDNTKKIKSFTQYGGLAIQWPSQFTMLKMTEPEIDEHINKLVQSIETYRLWQGLTK